MMSNNSLTHEEAPGVLSGWWLPTALLGVMLLAANSVFTVWKETPSFWHNAGGYPIPLRELVLAFYYPLLSVNLLFCLATTIMAVKAYQRGGRLAWWVVAAGVLMWAVLVFNFGWLATNNVENLMIGRELHYHAPASY